MVTKLLRILIHISNYVQFLDIMVESSPIRMSLRSQKWRAHHDNMAIPRRQSVGYGSPLPAPIPLLPPSCLHVASAFPALLRTCIGADGCSCGCSHTLPFCRCLLLILTPFPGEDLAAPSSTVGTICRLSVLPRATLRG